MRRVLLVAATAAALLLPGRPVWACSCAELSDAAQARRADAIFTGTALSSEGGFGAPTTTMFAVDTKYKGPIGSSAAVTHEVDEAACGLTFEEGTRYTVFADDAGGELSTNLCNGTSAGDVDAEALGLRGTPVAQTSGQRDVDVDAVWPFWVALSGLVFVIGALSMWDTRRRHRGGRGREREPN